MSPGRPRHPKARTNDTIAWPLANASVAFLDCLKEIPCFMQQVLPRLDCWGLRRTA
jgi:hypothetical protein